MLLFYNKMICRNFIPLRIFKKAFESLSDLENELFDMWLRFKINFIVIQHYLKDAMQNEMMLHKHEHKNI